LPGRLGQLVPEGDGVKVEAEGRGAARFCAGSDRPGCWLGLGLTEPGTGLGCPGLGVGVGWAWLWVGPGVG
jgi:hypothetical protein